MFIPKSYTPFDEIFRSALLVISYIFYLFFFGIFCIILAPVVGLAVAVNEVISITKEFMHK